VKSDAMQQARIRNERDLRIADYSKAVDDYHDAVLAGDVEAQEFADVRMASALEALAPRRFPRPLDPETIREAIKTYDEAA
jgi:hypothetical protein